MTLQVILQITVKMAEMTRGRSHKWIGMCICARFATTSREIIIKQLFMSRVGAQNANDYEMLKSYRYAIRCPLKYIWDLVMFQVSCSTVCVHGSNDTWKWIIIHAKNITFVLTLGYKLIFQIIGIHVEDLIHSLDSWWSL